MKVFGLCGNFIICSLDFRYTEAVVRRCSSEQALLKISQCWSFFLIKLQAFRHQILLKRDFNKGQFLWNLQNRLEHLFYRTLTVAASGNIIWTLSLLHNANDESLFGTYWLSSTYFISLRVFRFFLFLSLFSIFLCIWLLV